MDEADEGQRRIKGRDEYKRETKSDIVNEREAERAEKEERELDVLSLVRAEGDRFPDGLFPSVPPRPVIGFSRLRQVVCEGTLLVGAHR